MAVEVAINHQVEKEVHYQNLIPQIRAVVQGESDMVANLGNIAAILKYGMDFFWVGFYLVKDEELVLGPFQGTPACTRIAKGRGVCGAAWAQKKTLIVADVHQFPGHIACSPSAKSEIVIPIKDENGKVFMIIDVDSDKLEDFDDIDRRYLEEVAEIIQETKTA